MRPQQPYSQRRHRWDRGSTAPLDPRSSSPNRANRPYHRYVRSRNSNKGGNSLTDARADSATTAPPIVHHRNTSTANSGWGRPRPPSHKLSKEDPSRPHALPPRTQARVGTLNWSTETKPNTQHVQIPKSRWTPPEGRNLTLSPSAPSSIPPPTNATGSQQAAITSTELASKAGYSDIPRPTQWGWNRSQLNTPLN
jgi:hypothetical protein